MSKHTPWEVVEMEDGRLCVAEVGTGLAVCQVKQPRAIAEPKARLMAVAPDLLEACEAFLASKTESAEEEAAIKAMRKAVATAKDDRLTLAVIARLERGGQS
jgi:hypothetical protein